MAVRVGLKNAVIAQLTKDLSAVETESGTAEVTYGQIISLPRAQQIDLTASTQSVNVDADDWTDVIDQCSGYSGTITRDNFSPEEMQIILGEKKVNGYNISTASDEAPYFALGFKSELKGINSDGKYLYMWVLKTKFAQSNMTLQSKGNESLTPQADAITFKSSNRACDGGWRIYTRSNDANMDSKFFSAETLQTLANAASQVYSSPVQAAKFVDSLPDTGDVGTIYVVGGTAAHYWNGAEFVSAPTVA